MYVHDDAELTYVPTYLVVWAHTVTHERGTDAGCLVVPCACRCASVECGCQVSVCVGYVLALLVLPCLVNVGGQVQVKSKSSSSQVESGRAIPRGPSLPIGLVPPPAPISFAAHHQGEPNLPGFFFPFGPRFQSWLILTVTAWRLPPAELNSQGAYCAYPYNESCPRPPPSLPLLAASAGCPQPRPRLTPASSCPCPPRPPPSLRP
jgi:hypothetical protein